MNHQQMLPCFYMLIAVYALSRLAGDRSNTWRARAGYWLLAALAGVAQLYSGAYMGWFLIVGTALAAAGALMLKACRPVLISILRRDFWMIAGAAALSFLLLQPFRAHYKIAADEVKGNYYPAMRRFSPGSGHGWTWAPEAGSGALPRAKAHFAQRYSRMSIIWESVF